MSDDLWEGLEGFDGFDDASFGARRDDNFMDMPPTPKERRELFFKLSSWKRELSARLNAVEKDLAAIGEVVINDLVEDGVSSMKINGATLYLHSRPTVKILDMPAIVRGFESSGIPEMVSVNTTRLSTYVKELTEGGEALPEWLSESIERGTVVTPRIRGLK